MYKCTVIRQLIYLFVYFFFIVAVDPDLDMTQEENALQCT